MSKAEVAKLIATCLKQKVNFDPMVNDEDREWWYVNPLYKKNQDYAYISTQELVAKIREFDFSSIQEVMCIKMPLVDHDDRSFIQIRGERKDIIKECESYK